MCESVCVVEYVLFKKQAGVYSPQDFKPEREKMLCKVAGCTLNGSQLICLSNSKPVSDTSRSLEVLAEHPRTSRNHPQKSNSSYPNLK